jgi:hypothetical protein
MKRFSAVAIALGILSGCEFRGSWKPGEIYSIKASAAGGFFVCKVLANDEDFVWLGVYPDNKFSQRPTEADLKGLSKWSIIWSTHSRMKQDEPQFLSSIPLSTEEVAGLLKAKTMLHVK